MSARDLAANAATLAVCVLTYAHVLRPIFRAITQGGHP